MLIETHALTKIQAILIAIIVICAAVGGTYIYWITSTVKEKTEILIGFPMTITGAYAKYGRYALYSYLVWQEEVNSAGGIYVKEYGRNLTVRLIYYDDKSDPTTSSKLLEKLITVDGVDICFSTFSSTIMIAVSSIAEKYQKVIIPYAANALSIYNRGLTYVFNIQPLAFATPTPIVSFLAQANPRPQRILVVNDQMLSMVDFTNYTVRALTQGLDPWPYGEPISPIPGVVVDVDSFTQGTTDFSSLIAKIREGNYDVVIFWSYYEGTFTCFKQMREQRVFPKYLLHCHDGANNPDWLLGLPANASEGLTAIVTMVMNKTDPKAQTYIAKYKQLSGLDPSPGNVQHWAGGAYAEAQILQQAILSTGTLNNKALRDYLRSGVVIPTIMGNAYWDDISLFGQNFTNINLGSRVALTQIQNNTIQVIWPPEYATATPWYPMLPSV